MDRSNPHMFRGASSYRHHPKRPKDRQIAAFGNAPLHQDHGGRPIRQLTGIARCDHAALAHRLQRGQPITSGLRTVSFVPFQRHDFAAHLTRHLVLDHAGRCDWHNLCVKPTGGLGLRNARLGD